MKKHDVLAVIKQLKVQVSLFFIVFFVMILAAVFYFSYQMQFKEKLNEYQSLMVMHQEAKMNEEQLLDDLGLYHQLQLQGIIGDPNRLQWIELLDWLSKQIGIPSLQFLLEKTKKFENYNSPFWNDEIGIETTDMRLNMLLLHEGQYFHLLQQLHRLAKGVFSIKACKLSQRVVDDDLPAFFASCELEWFNLSDVTLRWRDSAQ